MPTVRLRSTLLALLLAFAAAAFAPILSLAAPPDGPQVVFIIGEEGYQTGQTLPEFAKRELEPLSFRCTILQADPQPPRKIAGFEAVASADILFLSVRRIALPAEQMSLIRQHLDSGKPLVAIRTSSHAFAPKPLDIPPGYVDWPTFDADVLGGKYAGDFGNRDGTNIATTPRAEQHEILAGVRETSFRSGGSLYKSLDLASTTAVLLRGVTTDQGQPLAMPVAWTNTCKRARVFYTSLGHVQDFQQPTVNRMLVNAVHWCLKRQAPSVAANALAPASGERDRYKNDLAGNEQVQQIIRTFEGKGEIGDNSLPTPPEQAVKQLQVQAGFEVELLAHEPTIRQPLQMSWDHRGRLWVVQYLQYPFPAGLKVVKYDQYLRAVFDKVPPPPPHHFPGADKITVLEDTDGDGRFDSAKDVITGLNIVSAVTTGRGGIWVLNPPYLLFYPDTNGDDVPDADPEVHLSGFGLEDTHSVANSLKWGPDGWLYGANGSTTTGTINSAATKNVAFQGQMIWRYHPGTKVFEIYAEGGGNTFSLEIDGVGRVFSGTNNAATRGMHYVQGGYAEKNWGKHGPLTNPYAFGNYEHMRHEGFMERFSQTFLIYEGGALPERYRHAIISANSLQNQVLAAELLPDTSSFRTVDMPPLVLTTDRWFRPVDVEVGPDGAVYMADWYDTRLTHVDPRDNWHKESGRLYRLKAAGAKPIAPFDLSKKTDDELIALFGHENKWFRQQAMRMIGERRNPDTLPKLRQLAERDDPRSLEALWALNLGDGLTDQVAARTLQHPSPHVRRWTVRLLGDRRQVSPAVAAFMAAVAQTEPDLEVRSQLASSAKRISAEAALPIVRNLLARDEDIADLHIPLLLWWAIESKAESDRDTVLAMFKEPAVWNLPIIERCILERLMQRYAMPGDQENLRTCAALLALSPGERQTERLMVGLLEAFRGRQMTNLPPTLAEALDKHQKSLGNNDLALGLRLGKADAINQAIKFIANEKSDKSTRLAYLEILGQINQPKIIEPLIKLIGSSPSHAVKRVSMQALMNYDDPQIGVAILRNYHGSLLDEQGVRSTAQRVLASRPAWTLAFLRQIDGSRIDARSVPLDVVQQMTLHQDEQIQALVRKHWGKVRGETPAEKQQEIGRVAALLRGTPGEAEAGKLVFTKRCAVCHTLFGEGGKAGPDLTGYERTNFDFMLLAIVDPSAAIREEFTNFALITKDGRTLTGLIDEQNPRTVTLRGVDGQTTLINRDDVETLAAVPVSLMPDGLMSQLTEAETRDLFAYLMSRTPSRTLK